VHTEGVVELKVTVRPEEAVALTDTGESPSVLFARGLNVIVWLALATVCDHCVALLATKLASPP
jgi:hypothetical protein